ncbi:MAG: hydrogenase iron-sulfur subunit [Planctomycetes bacterium]|nr:hydrogenase iron-sulfur subunit [Planctomycetota bacterium]
MKQNAERKTQDAERNAQDAGRRTQDAFEPKIVAFLCNWCSYAGADLAGTSRKQYAPNIRIIKVPCTGRLDPIVLIKSFEMGADGILVSGCHPGDCHYRSGNYLARRRWMIFNEMLQFIGLEQDRVQFSWVSAAEGGKFVDVVNKITEDIKKLGPAKEYNAS